MYVVSGCLAVCLGKVMWKQQAQAEEYQVSGLERGHSLLGFLSCFGESFFTVF